LSSTDKLGTSGVCWCTAAIPAASACPGVVHDTASPCQQTVPLVAVSTPDIIRMSVDFPAPFAPIKPWTEPGRTASETPRNAWVPLE
jgi:hypothetical protein